MSTFLDEAIQAHTGWKIKLLQALMTKTTGQIDRQSVMQDCNCNLGKWIHGEGKVHAAQPAFLKLKDEHRQFHLSVGKVLELAAGNRHDEAKKLVEEGDYARHSKATVMAIMELKKIVH